MNLLTRAQWRQARCSCLGARSIGVRGRRNLKEAAEGRRAATHVGRHRSSRLKPIYELRVARGIQHEPFCGVPLKHVSTPVRSFHRMLK